jgi:leucine carboxyl methyltransferase
MESLGYLAPFYGTPFSHHFVTKASTSRASLINRGYALRVMIIRESLKRIMRERDSWQIVSLGAGFDTTFFWMAENGLIKGSLNYIEVDLPDVIEHKMTIIEQSDVLSGLLSKNEKYTLHFLPLDLQGIHDHPSLQDVVKPDLPTIFISECVLSYLDIDDADNVLKWAACSSIFSDQRHLILYEQLLATDHLFDPKSLPILDKFAQTMLAHFEALHCPLRSSHPYSTIHLQMERLGRLGWSPSIHSIDDASNWVLTQDMQHMIDGDAIDDQFDEEEEMAIKKSHYFLCTATVSKSELRGNHVVVNAKCDTFKWTPIQASTKYIDDTMLWGHTTCLFDNGHALLVFGGYGRHCDSPSTKSPARLNQLLVISTTQHDFLRMKQDSPQPEARIFPTIHLIKETEKCSTFHMFGGRGTPNHVFLQLWQLDLIKNDSKEYAASWTLLSTEAPFTSTRHQSVHYKDRLFVFDALNPLLIFHAGKWSKPRICPELRLATSHPFTATLWRDSIYLIGSHNLQLDPNTLTCTSLQIHSQSIKLPAIKYHTAMPIDTACWHGLILVGGLTTTLNDLSFAFRPELTIIYIDLIYHYWMPINAPGLHSLIKHSSALLPKDDAGFDILSIGGGSVCFSMGSYRCDTVCVSVKASIPLPTSLYTLMNRSSFEDSPLVPVSTNGQLSM